MFREESLITTDLRRQAARLALLATVGLTAFKFGVAYLSGSVGVLSEGVHSLLDLISAAVAFFAVPTAGKPADEDHPFGHGKIETLSSLFEALLLLLAAALIVREGLDRIEHPHPVEYQGLAILAIVVAMVVSYLVYRHNKAAAVQTESSAIHVNALHFLTDVVASAGVLVGLVLLRMTGWLVIDSVMAFGVAAYIVFISVQQVKGALLELSDIQLPDDEISTIRRILEEFKIRTVDTGPSPVSHIIEAHDLRTRKSGATRHIDFHLVVCGHMSVDESHSVCDQIEIRIAETLPNTSVNIHVEPCELERTACNQSCPIYKKRIGQ